MNVILVPGLWLDASSWSTVVRALEGSGHTTHALTMPGTGAPASDSERIGIADWVSAVVSEIDLIDGDVALVGHSGGGNVVYAAAGQRPSRVSRLVFVDTLPPTEGGTISEFPIVDGVIPFPGWGFFDDFDIADIDAATRDEIALAAAPVPATVPTDPIALGSDARRAIRSTMITNTIPRDEVLAILQSPPSWAAELAALEDLTIIDLREGDDAPGHWPQFTRPDRLSAAVLAALSD